MAVNVALKKLHPEAKIPTYGSAGAAGADLCACIPRGSMQILPHTTVMIGTGIAISLPPGYFGGVYARSGLSTKSGLRPANCVGVIDEDYTGEVIVALHNDTETCKYVHDGDRIAQLVIQPYATASFGVVEDLPVTIRGDGGFGSTGES